MDVIVNADYIIDLGPTPVMMGKSDGKRTPEEWLSRKTLEQLNTSKEF